MKPILCLSLTNNVHGWFANSRQLKILHVFDQACNLINEHKEALSIVTPQIGNGPFNLVVKDEVVFSDHLNIESSVSIFDNQLIIDDFIINIEDAKVWNPRPDWEMLHAEKDKIFSQLTSLTIPDPQLPSHLISGFSAALVNSDTSSAITFAKQLAGLGIGLTPSGDDFMMGAMYAAWIIHPQEIASNLLQEIANISMPLTTSLSAAWIRSAGRGEAGELWHDLFSALIASNASNIQLQIEKILSVGETSGADALAGFFNTFISWANTT